MSSLVLDEYARLRACVLGTRPWQCDCVVEFCVVGEMGEWLSGFPLRLEHGMTA